MEKPPRCGWGGLARRGLALSPGSPRFSPRATGSMEGAGGARGCHCLLLPPWVLLLVSAPRLSLPQGRGAVAVPRPAPRLQSPPWVPGPRGLCQRGAGGRIKRAGAGAGGQRPSAPGQGRQGAAGSCPRQPGAGVANTDELGLFPAPSPGHLSPRVPRCEPSPAGPARQRLGQDGVSWWALIPVPEVGLEGDGGDRDTVAPGNQQPQGALTAGWPFCRGRGAQGSGEGSVSLLRGCCVGTGTGTAGTKAAEKIAFSHL